MGVVTPPPRIEQIHEGELLRFIASDWAALQTGVMAGEL